MYICLPSLSARFQLLGHPLAVSTAGKSWNHIHRHVLLDGPETVHWRESSRYIDDAPAFRADAGLRGLQLHLCMVVVGRVTTFKTASL